MPLSCEWVKFLVDACKLPRGLSLTPGHRFQTCPHSSNADPGLLSLPRQRNTDHWQISWSKLWPRRCVQQFAICSRHPWQAWVSSWVCPRVWAIKLKHILGALVTSSDLTCARQSQEQYIYLPISTVEILRFWETSTRRQHYVIWPWYIISDYPVESSGDFQYRLTTRLTSVIKWRSETI